VAACREICKTEIELQFVILRKTTSPIIEYGVRRVSLLNLREKRARDKKWRGGGPGKRKCCLLQVAWSRRGEARDEEVLE